MSKVPSDIEIAQAASKLPIADVAAKLGLALDDLINLSDEEIRITPKGRLLLRNIAMVFDRHLNRAENDGRFSKAI